jgi:hypothetical protein
LVPKTKIRKIAENLSDRHEGKEHLMKKVTRTVTKRVDETVSVCDTCEGEKPLGIEGHWSKGCRYDNCYSDSGRFEFCSVTCFLAGAVLALDDVGDPETSFFESLTIKLDNDGAEFQAFVAYLKEYRSPTR